MLRNPLPSAFAVVALAGLAACGGGDDVADDAMVTDTLVTQETEMVEVPVTVPDTAVVTTDVDVDVDTVDIEGAVPPDTLR